MLCTFCGTENRPENKFCGMCGVRLERRQADRRVRPNGMSMKCSSCGHVNDPGQKFCGMCGTRVERRMQERRAGDNEPRAVAVANAHLPSPETSSKANSSVATLAERPAPKRPIDAPPLAARRTEPGIFRNESDRKIDNGATIGGPSFLGLGSQTQSNDVEYLLEDEPRGGGLRKLVLLALILAIAGLVFVQWRSSLKANPKPVPAKIDPATAPVTTPQGDNQPGNSSAAAPSTDDPKKDDSTTSDPSAVSADGSKDTKTEDKNTDEKPADPKAELSAPAADTDSADKSAAAATADKKIIKPEDVRLADYKPSPTLLRAQQYLRGRGVQQNCEQGLLYLHAATDKNDPGAAIQMAALYSSGVCVKQDRVMAYRWFNSAHELQPGNMYIQKNMDQLWAQMTSQERRLAGY